MRNKANHKQMTVLVSTVKSLHKMGRTPERALEFICAEYPFYVVGTYSTAIAIGFDGAYGMDKVEFTPYEFPPCEPYIAPLHQSESHDDILDRLFA